MKTFSYVIIYWIIHIKRNLRLIIFINKTICQYFFFLQRYSTILLQFNYITTNLLQNNTKKSLHLKKKQFFQHNDLFHQPKNCIKNLVEVYIPSITEHSEGTTFSCGYCDAGQFSNWTQLYIHHNNFHFKNPNPINRLYYTLLHLQ